MKFDPNELLIDKHNLDNECSEQAFKYMTWAKCSAEAGKRKARLEHELDKARGRVDHRIRKNPEEYGLDPGNVKEKSISYAIDQDEEVEQILEEYDDAVYEASNANSMKNAFDQRKVMLRVVAELWLGEYYSDVDIRESTATERRQKLGARRRKRLGK